MKVLTKKKKEQLKKEKLDVLNKIFEDVKESKKALVIGLIEQVCFMYVQLTELNEIIEKNGVIEEFKQGKQQFLREQPAVKTYNTMIKNYNLVTSQLIDLLPPGTPKIQVNDDFEKFKQKRNR